MHLTCNQDPAFCCIQETHFNNNNRHYFRVKGNGSRKQAVIAILISNKIEFQPKVIQHDEEGLFVFIKGNIHQEKV